MINKLGWYRKCQTCGVPLRLISQRVVGSCGSCARNTIDTIQKALKDPAKMKKVRKIAAKQGHDPEEIDKTIHKLEETINDKK